jgi:DNA end-binding protein Ku
MPPHAIASGTISFGLVSVPVKLYSATKSKNISFNLLHEKDHSRLRQQYICATCGEVVERNAMVKGYEYAKNQYAVVNDEELAALLEKSEQSIEIEQFVPLASVDPVTFEKAYALGPDKGGHKAYRLLAKAMERADKGGIARFSTRGKQQLVLLRQTAGGIMMHTLFYADEVRGFAEIDLGDNVNFKAGELDLAVQLIEQLAVDEFNHEQFRDEYRDKVLELIERKVAGQEIAVAAAPAPKAQIIDLMEALKASLGDRKRKKEAAKPEAASRRPARAKGERTAARRSAAKSK